MRDTVYFVVFDGFADWQAALALCEIRRPGDWEVRTVGFSRAMVTSMGGLAVKPDLALEEVELARAALLIVPGGHLWLRDEGHAVDAIVRRVQGRGAAVSFFVLDACRDNPLAATGTRGIGGTRGEQRGGESGEQRAAIELHVLGGLVDAHHHVACLDDRIHRLAGGELQLVGRLVGYGSGDGLSADINPHMRSRGALLYLDDLALELVACADLHRVTPHCGRAGAVKPCLASTRWPSTDMMNMASW